MTDERAKEPAAFEKIVIPETDAELLGECDVDTFRSGGKGGQHVNKTESAVRLTHRPSGVVVTCRADRSQHRNKALALVWLRHKLEVLNVEEKERVPTKTPRSLKRRILDTKRRTGQQKRLRSKPSAED